MLCDMGDNKQTQIGIVVTAHFSNAFREHGREYLETMVRSVESSVNSKYKIYVMDNESEIPFKKSKRYDVTRFENQAQYGLSRTWNFGASKAYKEKCEVIVVCNDDIEFTDSINKIVDFCKKNPDRENCLLGPVSNGAFNRPQRYRRPTGKIRERNSYILNGFCQAFHREFYKKYNVNEKLWNVDGTKNKWGGEEKDLYQRCQPLGMRSLICGNWFVKHESISGWWPLHGLEKKNED